MHRGGTRFKISFPFALRSTVQLLASPARCASPYTVMSAAIIIAALSIKTRSERKVTRSIGGSQTTAMIVPTTANQSAMNTSPAGLLGPFEACHLRHNKIVSPWAFSINTRKVALWFLSLPLPCRLRLSPGNWRTLRCAGPRYLAWYQGTCHLFPKSEERTLMVDRLKKSFDDLIAPECTKCRMEMKWYRSEMIAPGSDIVHHYFYCPSCGDFTKLKSKIEKNSDLPPHGKLSLPWRKAA